MHATVEGTPESFSTIKNERRQQYITQNETPKEVAVKNSRVEGVEERNNFEVARNRNLAM